MSVSLPFYQRHLILEISINCNHFKDCYLLYLSSKISFDVNEDLVASNFLVEREFEIKQSTSIFVTLGLEVKVIKI